MENAVGTPGFGIYSAELFGGIWPARKKVNLRARLEEDMGKQVWISAAVTFVLMLGFGFLVHAVILAGDYGHFPGLFRTEADQQKHFPFMLMGHAIAAFTFAWVYLRGKEAKPFLGQGIRYGLAIAGLMVIPKFLIYFAVQPIEHMVVLKQICFDTASVVVMGIVVAALNK